MSGARWRLRLGRGGGLAVCALVAWASVALALGTFPATLRIPRADPGRMPDLPRALFSHRTHGTLGCYACHPSTFPQAAAAFTHDDMRAGRFCGRCHDGRVAFAIEGRACGNCHARAR